MDELRAALPSKSAAELRALLRRVGLREAHVQRVEHVRLEVGRRGDAADERDRRARGLRSRSHAAAPRARSSTWVNWSSARPSISSAS